MNYLILIKKLVIMKKKKINIKKKYDFSNSEIEKLKQGMNSKEKEYNDKISLLEMKIKFFE